MTVSDHKQKAAWAATPRKDRNNRRQLILDKAAELFAAQGYQATSMDQLSELTTLNKGTIYYYYKSKADILFDMSYFVAERALKLIAPASKMEHASDAFAHAIEVTVDWIIDHKDVVTTYFQESPYFKSIFSEEQYRHISDQQSEMMKFFYETIEKGIRAGEFREVDTQITGRLVVGGIMWIYRWPEDEIDGARVSEVMISGLLNGLLRNPRTP